MTSTSSPRRGTVAAVVGLSFGAIMFDGYDLIAYGSAVPSLLHYRPWGLTAAEVGAIGSYSLVGMLIGAVASGALTDLIGRRKLFIVSLAWFSAMMLGSALAPTAGLLGLFRFLAGLGFGGIQPAAIALVIEFAPAARRQLVNGLTLCGFPIGGAVAALVAIVVLDRAGFRALFAVGALPLVTLVPLALWLLPESPTFVRRRAATTPARPRARELRRLFGGRSGIAAVLFMLANFCSFLLVFGLNTWLPQLMRGAGYPLGSALAFLLVLNIGAVAGGLGGSALADRHGSRLVATTLFGLAVVTLGLIAVPLPTAILYILVFLAGAATTGNQIVVYGYAAAHYPAAQRATALGLTSGVGRLGAITGPLLGGAMLAAGLGLSWNVTAFALIAVVAAVACALVPSATAPGEVHGPAGATESRTEGRTTPEVTP